MLGIIGEINMKYIIVILVITLSLVFSPQSFAMQNSTETVELKLPMLIDLGASKCKPCQKMAIILDELQASYTNTLRVSFIDVWKVENVEQAKIFKIQSIPTQIFQDPEGKELWRHVGYIGKNDIIAKWKELGYTVLEDTVSKKSSNDTNKTVPETNEKLTN